MLSAGSVTRGASPGTDWQLFREEKCERTGRAIADHDVIRAMPQKIGQQDAAFDRSTGRTGSHIERGQMKLPILLATEQEDGRAIHAGNGEGGELVAGYASHSDPPRTGASWQGERRTNHGMEAAPAVTEQNGGGDFIRIVHLRPYGVSTRSTMPSLFISPTATLQGTAPP
jgi:hypothetical protein